MRHLADRDSHVGAYVGRCGERHLEVDRRRRDVEAPNGRRVPERHVGKIGLGISKANSSRLYALIETGDGVPLGGQETDRGELFRSEDGGNTWRVISYDQQLMGRTHYYTRMAVMPDNDNEAYFLTAYGRRRSTAAERHDALGSHPLAAIITTSGSITPTRIVWSFARRRREHKRRIAASPESRAAPDRADVSRVGRQSRSVLCIGNRQDGPSTMGPSNSKMGGFFGDLGIPRGLWSSVGGGESGWAQPDPADSNLIWSSASGYGSLGGIVIRVMTHARRSASRWKCGRR